MAQMLLLANHQGSYSVKVPGKLQAAHKAGE